MSGARVLPNQVLPLSRTLLRQVDPLALLEALVEPGRQDVALLESADASTRHGLQSLLMTRAAVRAECRGRRVVLEALGANGSRALAAIAPRLEPACATLEVAPDRLVADFDPIPPGPEATRLKAPSPADALRAMATGWELVHEPHPLALPSVGAFAYDFIDVYEPLPDGRARARTSPTSCSGCPRSW